MNHKTQTFIFIHDQDLIIRFIDSDRYRPLQNVSIVFLGAGSTEKLTSLTSSSVLWYKDTKIIVARNTRFHMEDYPRLTAFSGWYCLWKNSEHIDADTLYVHMFEYDIRISSHSFFEGEAQIVNDVSADVVGYITYPIHHINFLGIEKWCDVLLHHLKVTHGCDAKDMISRLLDRRISLTSNHTFHILAFYQYMEWVAPVLFSVRSLFYAGHYIERSISLFCLYNDMRYAIRDGSLQHFQLDSHGTQACFSEDKYHDLVNSSLLF